MFDKRLERNATDGFVVKDMFGESDQDAVQMKIEWKAVQKET